MSYIQLDNPIARDFAMVPDALWSWPGLSFKAKGFFAYLLSFRHGVCPPVAAMEAQTGLGRDARKAAMRELESAGLARWVIRRDPAGRVVAKFLEVSTRPLLAAILAADTHAPENPSHGAGAIHAPEKPSDGKSGAGRLKIRASSPENPAMKEKKEKEKSARDGSAKPVQRRARRLPPDGVGAPAVPQDVATIAAKLSPFQRKQVREGQGLVLDGEAIEAGSATLLALQSALTAVERGSSVRGRPAPDAAAALVGAVARALEKGAVHDARS